MSVKETEWQFNARNGKTSQAVECLADIRRPHGRGSAVLVFDFGQLDGGNEQEKKQLIPLSPLEIEHLAAVERKRSMNCKLCDERIGDKLACDEDSASILVGDGIDDERGGSDHILFASAGSRSNMV